MGITSMLVLLHSRVKVQDKCILIYINICIQYVCSQQLHTKKEQTPAFFVSPVPTQTYMQWTEKQGQNISQSDPYHYLPCKAHLTGRPAAQTSAIFTYILSCVRSPQLHLECEALWHSETKARKNTCAQRKLKSPNTEYSTSRQPASDFSRCNVYTWNHV